MSTTDEIDDWQGQDVVDPDGKRLGSVGDIYLGQQTARPAWIAIKTALLSTKLSVAPLAGARGSEDGIVVPYTKHQLLSAPRVEADGALSRREEAALRRHYGLHDRSDAGDPGR